MGLHHNGMGAKFTDYDTEYIRNYFLWSVKYYPNRTRDQVLEKIHEKMPYHSVVAVTQFMRRHPESFTEFRKSDPVANLPVGPKAEKMAPGKGRDYQPDVLYDPGNANDEEPPKPPTNLITFAKGYRFTSADDQFIIAYFNWHAKRYPGATKGMVLRDLSLWAPYRSLPSWTTYLRKHIHEWRNPVDDESDQDPVDDESDQDPVNDESDQDPVDDESDTELDGVPYIPAEDELPPTSFPYHPLPPAQDSDDDDEEDQLRTDDDDYEDILSVSNEPPTRTTSPAYGSHGEKTNMKGKAYFPLTQEQKARFIDFLAQNPQVWARATPEPGWVSWELTHQLKDITWRKLAAVPGMDNRSYQSWREYHRARAARVDPEAKRLRLRLEAASKPSAAPSISIKGEESRKRSRSAESDMDPGAPLAPDLKRIKVEGA
ncbi:hypothetical protein FRC00_007160 [Tulasnella sp. 408]|nr:hypothetical protein FRC00_007160 [Tulasnella sp. 408]